MSAFSLDTDMLIAIAAGLLALAALIQAIRTMRAGKIGRGGLLLAAGAALALISYFFATFSIRLF